MPISKTFSATRAERVAPASQSRSETTTDASASPRHIACVGEFIDALDRLQRGHPLVQVSAQAGGWALDGCRVFWAHETLQRFGLLESYRPAGAFGRLSYYRLSLSGRVVANHMLTQWRRLPLWQRLWLRLRG
ncbi:MAG: hypothetical protein JNJ71_12790 [Rubrivivax sp.]|nr:hypothetical protein [Rubrivivax sp.]